MAIRKQVNEMDFLSFSEKKLLVAWTDPSNPQGSEIYKKWLADIQEGWLKLNLDNKLSLV